MNSQKPCAFESKVGSKRLMHLDGIRGVAALAVALFHFFRSFDNSFISSENFANRTFFSSLWNGHFAVSLFFVLSGYLFFEKFYHSKGAEILAGAFKRYFRLCIPILSICLFAYGTHKIGLFFNKEAGLMSGSDWLTRWYSFRPDLTLAVSESFWNDFISFDANLTYNSNLWTISYELFAVIMIMTAGFISNFIRTNFQVTLLIAMAILSYGTHYLEFSLGALLALGSIHLNIRLKFISAIIIALIAISMGALNLPNLVSSYATDLLYPLGAALLIGSVNANLTMGKVFSNNFFLKLGEISFGLYLMHFIMLSSVAAAIYIRTESITSTFLGYAAATTIASILFTYAVDKPWMHFLNKCFGRGKRIITKTATS